MSHKKQQQQQGIPTICTPWMDPEDITLNEISQTIYHLTYIWNHFLKCHQKRDQTCSCQRWGEEEERLEEGGQMVQSSS